MTPKAITQMQAVEIIQDHMKKIEPTNVVFAFKRMRVKPIRKTTVELMRACISIHDQWVAHYNGANIRGLQRDDGEESGITRFG